MFTAEDFKGEPVPVIYEKNGKKLNLMVEADLLTPQFLEEMANLARVEEERKREGKQERSWEQSQAEVTYYVNILSRAIAAWDLKDKEGRDIACTPEFLRTLPILALADLLTVCMNAGMPEKKATGQESDDSTQDTPESVPQAT